VRPSTWRLSLGPGIAACVIALAIPGVADARTSGRLPDQDGINGYCSSTTVARRVDRVSNSDITSVGITYFAGRSRTGDDAHIAAALTQEVATQLLSARVRTTAPSGRAGGTRLLTVKLSDGGGFAEVDLAMTGSVFRDGDLLRTQVRVTRTSDGSIVWRGTLVRPLLELPMLARLVAQNVAVRIGAQLTSPSPRPTAQRSADVYELILRGSYIRSRYDPETLEDAIGYFNQALKLDPKSSVARTSRDQAELRLVAWGGLGDTLETRLLSRGLLAHVLERDRDESERLVEEADGEMRDNQPVHACQLLNTAIETDARSSPAYALRAIVRARGGDVREAFGDAEVVAQLGRPRWGDALRALVLSRSGDSTSARRQARRLIADTRRMRGPLPFWDARFLAAALVETGYAAEARAVLARIDARDPRVGWLRNDPLLQSRPVTSRRARASG
jgi:TolB-like protein